MIGKAKAISHGVNCLRYIMGESSSKKHPERIYFVKNNLLDPSLDAAGIYDRFNFACSVKTRLKDKVIRIELSPSKRYTEGFTLADWQRLWDDFIREFDSIEIRNQKTGRLMSCKTNLANTMGTVWLHRDSRGGIPHLHGAYCRVDEDGVTNNDHRIEVRAQLAAERVARKRGWVTAREVHDVNVEQVKQACLSVLRGMVRWDWELYARELQARGLGIHLRKDNAGIIVGYSLIMGNSVFHASKLNTRRLTAAHIEETWRALHQAQRTVATTKARPVRVDAQPLKPSAQVDEPLKPDYSIPQRDTVPHPVVVDGQERTLHIPQEVDDYFANEFDESKVANSTELSDMAVALFAQLLIPSVSESPGGGSGESPKREKNEDDLEWARRCVMFAKSKLGVKSKRRFRR